jgi:hypothetical protein
VLLEACNGVRTRISCGRGPSVGWKHYYIFSEWCYEILGHLGLSINGTIPLLHKLVSPWNRRARLCHGLFSGVFTLGGRDFSNAFVTCGSFETTSTTSHHSAFQVWRGKWKIQFVENVVREVTPHPLQQCKDSVVISVPHLGQGFCFCCMETTERIRMSRGGDGTRGFPFVS